MMFSFFEREVEVKIVVGEVGEYEIKVGVGRRLYGVTFSFYSGFGSFFFF